MKPQQDVITDNTIRSDHHQRTLCEQLWIMRTEGFLCDAMLEVGGEQLQVHQIVLSACSPYLKQCCISPDSVTPCGSVSIHIDTYSYKVCLKAVEYLYTGRVEGLNEQHLMEEFHQLCQEWELLSLPLEISSILTYDNCLDSTYSITPTEGTVVLRNEPDIQTLKSSESNALDSQKVFSTRSTIGRRCKRKHIDKSAKYSKQNLVSKHRLPPVAAHNLKSKGVTQSDSYGEAETSVIEVKSNEEKPINCDNNDCDIGDENNEKNIEEKPTDNIKDESGDDNENISSEVENHTTDFHEEVPKTKSKTYATREKIRLKPHIKLSIQQKSKLVEDKSQQPLLFKKNSCQPCAVVFASREECLVHRKKMHPKLRKVWCEVCKRRFADSNLLQLHNMEHHWKEGMKLAKKYVCTEPGCSFSSFIYATWHKHKNLHNAEPRVCEICGKTLKNEFTLKQHVENMHTRTTTYPCDICDKTFSTKGNLKAHTEARHTDKTTREKLVCPQCAFVCWCKPSMSEHLLLKHNELMPAQNLHQCEICDFKTTIRTKMKEHTRTHSAVERLACSICGKTYKSTKLLNRHKKIHDNTAKVTRCLYCDYTTLHGVGTLSNHLRFKHKDRDPKPWRCDECSHKAITKESLVHHLQYVHKRDFDTYTSTLPTEQVKERTLTDDGSAIEQALPEQNQALSTLPELVATKRTQAERSVGSTSTANSGTYQNLLTAQSPVTNSQPDIAVSVHTPLSGLLPSGLLSSHGQPLYSPGINSSLLGGAQGYSPLAQSYMYHDGMVNPMYVHNMGF